jgi:hypothetical protein
MIVQLNSPFDLNVIFVRESTTQNDVESEQRNVAEELETLSRLGVRQHFVLHRITAKSDRVELSESSSARLIQLFL